MTPEEQVRKAVTKAKNAGHVIVANHWGIEWDTKVLHAEHQCCPLAAVLGGFDGGTRRTAVAAFGRKLRKELLG